MRTSLSRHYYRLDEVRAALRDCIINRRVDKGLFWTQELLDSGEDDYLFETLVEVWAFAVGPAKFRWIIDAYQTGKEDLLSLSLQLLRLPRTAADGSLLGAVLRAYEGCRLAGQLASPASSFREAVRKGDIRTAVTAWLQLEGGAAAALLGEQCALAAPAKSLVLEALSTWPGWAPEPLTCPIWATLCAVLAIMGLCMTEAQWAESTKPYTPLKDETKASLTDLLDEWRGLLGRRARRQYEIPQDCLKWDTARGRMRRTERTTSELWRVWEVMRGTRCWDDLAAVTGYRWAGYDTEGWADFAEAASHPDDWPDEWSAESQGLSHGDGCLGPSERLYRPQWLRRWLPDAALIGETAEAIRGCAEQLEEALGGRPDAVYMWEFLEYLPTLPAMGWAGAGAASTLPPVPECPQVAALASGVKSIKLSELRKKKVAKA